MGSRIDPRFCTDSRGIVHFPLHKQRIFTSIDELEAMYGGAAGGGKSDAILQAFLQYVDLSYYRGLILRRRSVDLERSEAILARAMDWWLPTRKTGVRYFAKHKKFVFPSGATCEFGHINNERDVENYQGGAWHFIAFDELTQFTASQYLYLFSRLRRSNNDLGLELIPLRMRSATNPGGTSHIFVRNRFMSLEYARAILEKRASPYHSAQYIFEEEDGSKTRRTRFFVPSLASDIKEVLDVKSYRDNLRELDVVTREQLMTGDWLIAASGRFKPEWFKVRYRHPDLQPASQGGYYTILRPDGSVWDLVKPDDCYRFATIDPAGTEAELTAEANQGREPSDSVISIWDHYARRNWLILRSVKKMQGEFPEVMDMIRTEYAKEKPACLYVERDGIGRPYYQQLTREHYPTGIVATNGKDKVTRAAPATNEAKEGRIIIPEYASWLDAWEAEIFSWTGVKGEKFDQGDTMSYAVEVKLEGFAAPMVWQQQ